MAAQNEDFIEQMVHRKNKSWMNFIIIGVNVVLFILTSSTGGEYENTANMIKWGASYAPLIQNGEYYRLFTCMFLHFTIQHLASNMLVLFFVGDYLERYLGKIRYLILYLGAGLCGNLLSYFAELRSGEPAVSAGASGAILGVVGGLTIIVLLNNGKLYELTLNRILLMAGFSLFASFTSSNIDWAAHLGGFLGGAVIGFIFFVLPRQKYSP